MRSIHLAQLDKVRPALLLTRASVVPYLKRVTIAPITATVRGLSTELPIGRRNGLDKDCVVSLDNITTIPKEALLKQIGYLLPEDEPALITAIVAAFRLDG
jgi:mRNA interferase MazF